MTQSALEWLEEQLFELRNPTLNQIEILKQAKDMERQQLIDCGNSCALMQHIHNDKINKMTESEIRQFAEEEHLTFGEEYFNKNFKKL